ncbi:RNA polymerase factor sigma-54 [Aquamicrobium segne]|uniref:RNA polymerase sigma-54 factor n=1 Tax=Aquamicrobium segne TaxID=469547 RepID=A0ABW0GY62_9HYPH
MALSAKLQLRQTQSLVLTPQLMQSIRLLQMTHAEIQGFIDDEIEKNPLLEWQGSEGEAFVAEPEKAAFDAQAEAWYESGNLPDAEALVDRLDTSMDNIFPDEPARAEPYNSTLTGQWPSSKGAGSAGAGENFDLDDFVASRLTLREHVRTQIALTFKSSAERIIATELADELDEVGYMRGDIGEIAARLGASRDSVQNVLARCQDFTPTGIFACSLSECLSLQLAERNRLDPAMAMMLAHLELIGRRDIEALKRLTGLSTADVLDMIDEIRQLDPQPGTAFTAAIADTVVPDIIVRAASDGSWLIELNPEALPKVLIDNVYFSQVQEKNRDPVEREFLADCMRSANWLVRSLDQRARTVLKVATEIVKQQDGFFTHGIAHLRPLNLRMVADAIGMHESTISRATANKFMSTPRGTIEMRYFFTAAIASLKGAEAHSSEAVRVRIRDLIDAEAPDAILSDDAIVDLLRESGIDIARRTVAKYREGLHIPSSVQRRREKQALASL